MKRIWHHNKPAKNGQTSKTLRPDKKCANQGGNKEAKGNPEGALKFHGRDCTVCSSRKHKAVHGTKEKWYGKKPPTNFNPPKVIWEMTKHVGEGLLVRRD